jgi:DUF4097 and DUF4098 domain-containing protein YvlB
MNIARIAAALAILLLVPFGLYAKCPIAPNGTLVVNTPSGNLIVDTTGTDAVEVEVSNKMVPQEECKQERVVVRNPGAAGREIPDWKIRVPKSVSLDLTTQAGSITVSDTDGSVVTLRTTGGKVKALNIKGNAAIITQGGEITVSNIGGDAELRSGRGLVVGNIDGKASLNAKDGDIVAGFVKGSVKAETGGGNIQISESDGQMDAATRVGSITAKRVRGPLQATAESAGNIKVEQAGSWVHASTGSGDITIRLVPASEGGDNHADLNTALGNIILFLPDKMKATIDATMVKPAFGASRFFSTFPATALTPMKGLRAILPGGPEHVQQQLNGGGNLMKLYTSSGQIELRPGK